MDLFLENAAMSNLILDRTAGGARLAWRSLVLASVASTLALAQPASQKTFNTAEAACAALVAAAASNDEPALNAILGP